MPGYQFIHLEAYGFSASNRSQRPSSKSPDRKKEAKLTIQEVLDEAMRVKGACPHIASPEVPTELFSKIPLEGIVAELEWRRDHSTDPRKRKIRKDARCLLAGVSRNYVATAQSFFPAKTGQSPS